MSENSLSTYTEINLIGKPEDIVWCVDWLGNVYSGDMRFDKEALVAIAMDTPEFKPSWSGVEPISGGTKLWFVNSAGISQLIIVSLHDYLLDNNNVSAEFSCINAFDRVLGVYSLSGEDFYSYSVSAESDGENVFAERAREIFGEDWEKLSDTEYCEARLREGEKTYEED